MAPALTTSHQLPFDWLRNNVFSNKTSDGEPRVCEVCVRGQIPIDGGESLRRCAPLPSYTPRRRHDGA